MYFSSYRYYHDGLIYRFLLQKHNGQVSCLSELSFRVSNTDMPSIEDFDMLHSLRSLEDISGQKSTLKYSGSRYVGTTKKSFYLSVANIRKGFTFFTLEVLSLFFMSNFQKRHGRFGTWTFNKGAFVICCKDLQIFQNYYFSFLKSNFLINFYAFGGSKQCLLDELQLYKFNIKK